jgi:ABC-type oligopeptide transport system substrate-binding subunit
MALFEGFTGYHPIIMQPIPALAESWEISEGHKSFTFHIRKNARFSDGRVLTAHDFVYFLRRELSHAKAARNAFLAYPIKYAQAFNEGEVFVRDLETGQFLTEPSTSENVSKTLRLTLSRNDKKRAEPLEHNTDLRAIVEGKELDSVKKFYVGIEAVDDFTLHFDLVRSTPYFVGLTSHPFFRAIPRQAIERFVVFWTQSEHMVTTTPSRQKRSFPLY